MFFKTLVLTTLCATGALSLGKWECRQSGMICHWEGRSPSCGSTDKQLGFEEKRSDGTYKLQEWTRDFSKKTLWYRNLIDYDCQARYGEGCYSGYKRLWCKVPE